MISLVANVVMLIYYNSYKFGFGNGTFSTFTNTNLKGPATLSTIHVLHSFAFIVTVNIVTAFMIPVLAQVTEVH